MPTESEIDTVTTGNHNKIQACQNTPLLNLVFMEVISFTCERSLEGSTQLIAVTIETCNYKLL